MHLISVMETGPLHFAEEPARRIDYMLAFHCAPSIAGVKPANLVCLKKTALTEGGARMRQLSSLLGEKQVYIYRLAEFPSRELLLVYNLALLRRHLRRPENSALLRRYGYAPEEMSMAQMLERLARRIKTQGEYPHEIGVFMGYPVEDVEGFIANKGKCFRLCGYWKVYRNPWRARRIFSVYDRVRAFYCARVADGENIDTIQYGGMIQ